MSTHLHMLPPSVNNLTVRVFLRAVATVRLLISHFGYWMR